MALDLDLTDKVFYTFTVATGVPLRVALPRESCVLKHRDRDGAGNASDADDRLLVFEEADFTENDPVQDENTPGKKLVLEGSERAEFRGWDVPEGGESAHEVVLVALAHNISVAFLKGVLDQRGK